MLPPSVIIPDLHVVSVSIAPNETNTPLVVDADTVLSRAVTLQRMKPVSRRKIQIHQTFGRVQHQKLAPRRLPNVHELTNTLIAEKPLGVGALKGLYHIQRI